MKYIFQIIKEILAFIFILLIAWVATIIKHDV